MEGRDAKYGNIGIHGARTKLPTTHDPLMAALSIESSGSRLVERHRPPPVKGHRVLLAMGYNIMEVIDNTICLRFSPMEPFSSGKACSSPIID